MTNQDYPKTLDQSEFLSEDVITVKESIEHEFTEEDVTELKELYYELAEYKLNRESVIDRIKNLLTKMDSDPQYITDSIGGLDFESLGNQGIKTLENEMENIRYKIGRGWEYREKKCFGIRYPEIDTLAVYSSETGEFIKARPMKNDERQIKMRLI